nr:reverse transcriptase domain-containing protein [Tanacetum cinerariifolium]
MYFWVTMLTSILTNFLHVTQSIKVNGVTDDALRLYLFPHPLTHHATAWFNRLPRNSINTFEQMAKMFLGKYFSPSMVTKLKNEITNFRQRPDESLFEAWERYKLSIDRCPNNNMLPATQIDTFYNRLTLRHRDTINAAAALKAEMVEINKNLMKVLQINQQVKAVTPSCETCGGPHFYNDYPPTVGQTQNVCAAGAYQGAPVSVPKPNPKPSIPYPSRLHDQKLRDKTNEQKYKFFKIFKDLDLNISFADALILMPKFGPTIKSLLTNKDKMYELARAPLNEHCSAVILKKLPEKLGDPGKFLIPCDFSGMDECLALADLGASINLMSLSVWNKLSLPELTLTLMTLELADRLISRLIGVAEDVFVKVGKFHFPVDFVVVDFDADPQVPLIPRRSILKTGGALIDVYAGELTLRVNNEALTFNLDQTSRYSANYNDMMANRTDVIDMACEEYSQEVLGFSDGIASVNPTPYYDLIVSTSSPTLFLSRIVIFFSRKSMLSSLLKMILLHRKLITLITTRRGTFFFLKHFLMMIHHYPLLLKECICLKFEKNLKFVKLKMINLQLMSLPRLNSRTYLLISNTHFWRILMEDDFEPTVQRQRRVNPNIHEVIKKEVLKLLDAGLIHSISDSPCVSPIHCVSKKGGFTVVENEENKLILTRLVRGWRVCIDYRMLNEATRKDHFPLPFMDQMLERLARNEYYCFLDGFSGYFQIPIDPKDQEKTTFTCPYGMFAYQVFMDDFLVFGNSFETCLSHLDKMLQHCEDTNLCLNLEKSHFIVKEGIVLGHKISKNRIDVDKAKVDVIAKLPHPTTVKGAVLGKRKTKHFKPIHYASKTMTDAQAHYTTTKKELLAVVISFGMTPSCSKSGRIKSSGGVFTARKPLIFSRLATMEPPGDTKARTTSPKRCLTPVFIGSQSTVMPTTWLNHVTLVNSIDFMGLLPTSRGNKYILVAIDYLSKWVEAKTLPINDAQVVCKFLKSLFARFGTPRAIISDRGTHFCNDQFAKVMLKYDVTHRLATAYHPQTSGQVEVSNRGLKRILERNVGKNRISWSDKLDDALWAFCTVSKHPSGVLLTSSCDHLKFQLNELNEIRDQAYENSLIYKEKTKRIHDSNIKDRVFNVGDRVLLFNSRLKIFSGKLKTRWSGPFTITQVFPYGIVELSQTNGPNFKVNGHRLKHYFGEDIPKMVVLDFQTFPKDQ